MPRKLRRANATRAQRKRMRRKFRPGQQVTWGRGAVAHEIVEVRCDGVVVDVTDAENANHFARRQSDGRFFLFVAFDANNRNRSGRGPIRQVGVKEG